MSKDEPLLSNCPLETAEPSRNYARIPGYKKKYKKKTGKRREKKRKMNGVEINTRAYVATRLLLRWDYLYAVTLKTKVFGDYNHARLEVSWITSTRGLLLRGYTGRCTVLSGAEERGVDGPSLDRSYFSRLQPISFLFLQSVFESRRLACSAQTVCDDACWAGNAAETFQTVEVESFRSPSNAAEEVVFTENALCVW